MSIVDDFFDGISDVLDGILNTIPQLLQSYVGWFVLQAVLIALVPTVAILFNLAFFVITLVGLKSDAEDILGAPTIVAAILAFFTLAFNVWLVLTIG